MCNKTCVTSGSVHLTLRVPFVLPQVLPDEHARDMCLRFADMESKLGEIDRGRAIYSYCSQICDPRVTLHILSKVYSFWIFDEIIYLNKQVTAHFWQNWKEFEIRHGNEDTIREMLRIKRSVQATYNTQVNFMSSQMLKATTNATGTGIILVTFSKDTCGFVKNSL